MADQTTAPEKNPNTPTIALLFELENLAFQGRQVVFDVLKSVLADKDMKLTPVLFSRCCVGASIAEGLPVLLDLLGHPRVSAEKLLPEIMQGIRASLVDNTPKASATLITLLKQAQSDGYKIGAVSEMDNEAAQTLYAKLDIGEPDSGAIVGTESDTAATDSLAWKAAARAMNAIIPSCIALVTSSRSAHAAVAAGMRCIAIPDAYTSFQDFGGTDGILDVLDEGAAKTILDTLAVHP